MKKYTRYTAGLLVGMLTLSSCTNIKQGLLHERNAETISSFDLENGNQPKSGMSNWKILGIVGGCIVGITTIATAGIYSGIYYLYNPTGVANPGNGVGPIAFFTTPPGHVTDFQHTNMSPTEANSILESLKDAEKKYHKGTIVEHPMVLTIDNLQYLKQNNFSQKSIEVLLKNKLNVNAKKQDKNRGDVQLLTYLVEWLATTIKDNSEIEGGYSKS